jgi:hypothetical protein
MGSLRLREGPASTKSVGAISKRGSPMVPINQLAKNLDEIKGAPIEHISLSISKKANIGKHPEIKRTDTQIHVISGIFEP